MAVFTGNENHDITLSEAAQMTANYRNAQPGQVKGHYFGGEAIRSVLSQAGCVGMRIYYGVTNDGAFQPIVVGVDSNGNDITDGVLMERAVPCPPDCGNANVLNS